MAINIPTNPEIASSYFLRKVKARKFLTLSVLAWLIMILLVVLYLVPQITKTVEAYQTLDKSRQELQRLQDKLSFIQTFQGNAFRAQERQIASILPSTKPLLPLLNTLGQLSQSQQVTLTNIELSPGSLSTATAEFSRSTGELQKLPVQISVSGDISRINAFLNALNTATPILEMSDISLSPVGNSVQVSTSSAQYNGNIGLVAYYAPITVKTVVTQKLPTLSLSDETFIKDLQQFVIYPSTLMPTIGQEKEDLFAF